MSEHILWETIDEQKEKIADLKRENLILGERCNQLLKDKGDLTDTVRALEAVRQSFVKDNENLEEENNKLLDVISNYEVKVADLEKENESLKGDLELWESGGCRATNLFECGVVKELKQQIEKMKKYIKACWVEENLNDYSSYITNSSEEFRDFVKELNEEIRNGR